MHNSDFIYDYDPDLKLFILTVKGSANAVRIAEHYKYISEDTSFPKDLKLLIDTRDCVFLIKANEVLDLVKSVRNSLTKFTMLKEALLVKGPHEVVIGTLFAKSAGRKNYKVDIFSTREAAIQWLKKE